MKHYTASYYMPMFIEMGAAGPKVSVVGGDDSQWVIDKPHEAVPFLEELIPMLETAGHGARKCAEEGKKILGRWRALQTGEKPSEADLKWLVNHVKLGPGVQFSVSSKDPAIVNRAAAITEKILGRPQPVEKV
jgi:hypothetical protein